MKIPIPITRTALVATYGDTVAVHPTPNPHISKTDEGYFLVFDTLEADGKGIVCIELPPDAALGILDAVLA